MPKPRPLPRRLRRIQPNRLIEIFCEGKNTEPLYLREFAQDVSSRLTRVNIVPEIGVPLTVVQAAVTRQKELAQNAKKSSDSFSTLFEVWAVFDMDEHPNVPAAKQIARANGVRIAFSNPCFELWGYLHFKSQDAHIHRRAMQSALKKEMPKYDPKREKSFDYSAMKDGYADACQRAEVINERRNEEGTPDGNPSTTVHKLMISIAENKITSAT